MVNDKQKSVECSGKKSFSDIFTEAGGAIGFLGGLGLLFYLKATGKISNPVSGSVLPLISGVVGAVLGNVVGGKADRARSSSSAPPPPKS